MLTQERKSRVSVILVRARNPNNIGAVARAMHDFGFISLRVVNDFPVPFEAARSAVDASQVLAQAVSCATVAEAVADCNLVIGTTAVGERDLQHELVTLADAAPRIHDFLHNSSRVALLFGSEKTGLSNEELSHCNWLLTIPMQHHAEARHPSMNLGQAVAVCLYELVRLPAQSKGRSPESFAHPPSIEAEQPASAAELERLSALLAEVMEETGYTQHHPANSDTAHTRRLLRRMSADASAAPVWMGILRQILWKLRTHATNKEA